MKPLIGTVKGIRRCSIYPCKGIAKCFIGDSEHQHLSNNLFLCDEHLKVLYKELVEKYEINAKTIIVTENSEVKNEYIKLQFQNSGITSKTKLIEFCKEHNIELPDEINMKGILKVLFPEIVGEEDVQAIE